MIRATSGLPFVPADVPAIDPVQAPMGAVDEDRSETTTEVREQLLKIWDFMFAPQAVDTAVAQVLRALLVVDPVPRKKRRFRTVATVGSD